MSDSSWVPICCHIAVSEEEGEDEDQITVSSEGCRDYWTHEQGSWTRVHVSPRRTLCTPLRISGAPSSKSLTGTRITHGIYCGSRKAFEVIDKWTVRESAHADVGEWWTGSTTFVERVNTINGRDLTRDTSRNKKGNQSYAMLRSKAVGIEERNGAAPRRSSLN